MPSPLQRVRDHQTGEVRTLVQWQAHFAGPLVEEDGEDEADALELGALSVRALLASGDFQLVNEGEPNA